MLQNFADRVWNEPAYRKIWRWFFIGHPQPLFRLFSYYQINITFLLQIFVNHVHPVYSAGIETHELHNMSLLP